MAPSIKCLWAEYVTTNARLTRFRQHIIDTGVNSVCIRSESLTKDLIEELHGKGLKVYGWCYPHSYPANSTDRSFAPTEAAWVVQLISYGLDGYIFDIEMQDEGKPNDWSSTGAKDRHQRASEMASTISTAFKAGNIPYLLGLTSHQWGFSNYEGVPWQEFLDVCNILFPQTYWRADDSKGGPKACNPVSWDYLVHPKKKIGTVDQALKNGFLDYADKKDKDGNLLPIIPLVGELGCAKQGEMSHAWQLIQARGIDQFHVYVDVDKPGWTEANPPEGVPSVLDEVKAI